MGKEDEIEVTTIKDVEKGTPTPAPVAEEKTGCAACVCSSSADAIPDATHVLAVRIVGAFAFAFAVIEFGLGGALFNYFVNEKMGAWWVGLIVALAAICAMVSANKGWLTATCVISSASCVVAVVGAAYDGVYSNKFRGIAACSSQIDSLSASYNYGDSDYFANSQICMISAQATNYVSDGCYCASRFGSHCYQLTLSAYSTKYSQNCGNIMTTYASTMSTSVAFCVACFCLALTLAILSGVVLCCAHRIPGNKTDGKDEIPAEVVVNEATPADASVVPSPDVEIKVGHSVIA